MGSFADDVLGFDPPSPYAGAAGMRRIPPPAIPVELSSEAILRDREKYRQKMLMAGRRGTILTQGQSLAQGGATILGRSA